jgi:hypothetical protein
MVAQIIGNPFVPVKSNLSPAANLTPFERRDLAVKGLARLKPIGALAEDRQISRKFIYKQIEKADRALDSAFSPEEEDDRVLYRIPVTKDWIHQVALSAILDCHGSYRGVEDFLSNTLDYELSVGAIHNVVMAAVEKARLINGQEDLSPIRVGAHDELPPQGGMKGG